MTLGESTLNVTLDLWQLGGFVAAIVGAFWAMAKVAGRQLMANLDDRFKHLNDQLEARAVDSRRLERELLDLKAELPREYVRREDFNRVQATIEVKIDNVRLLIERLLIQREKNDA